MVNNNEFDFSVSPNEAKEILDIISYLIHSKNNPPLPDEWEDLQDLLDDVNFEVVNSLQDRLSNYFDAIDP